MPFDIPTTHVMGGSSLKTSFEWEGEKSKSASLLEFRISQMENLNNILKFRMNEKSLPEIKCINRNTYIVSKLIVNR